MKASACIEMLYTEYPFLERLERARAAGFDAIEFWEWENKDLPAIRDEADRLGLRLLAFQGNLTGTLVHPHQQEAYINGVQQSLRQAQATGVAALTLLTDELDPHGGIRYPYPEISHDDKYHNVLEGLQQLDEYARMGGVTLLIEPLNILVDYPGYFLYNSTIGLNLVRSIGSPTLLLLYDVYHMQIMEGNIIHTLLDNLPWIGHIQIADVPGRHEPGTGELNFRNILNALRRAGYDNYIGCEFRPTKTTEEAVAPVIEMIKG